MCRAAVESVWHIVAGADGVHSRSAGLEEVLFPGLVASPAVLTNARGVYSPALAEFAIAALLFFAKGVRRMLRSQAEGMWTRSTWSLWPAAPWASSATATSAGRSPRRPGPSTCG